MASPYIARFFYFHHISENIAEIFLLKVYSYTARFLLIMFIGPAAQKPGLHATTSYHQQKQVFFS